MYSFSDDSQDDLFIQPNMVPLTEEEIERHLNPQKYMTLEEKRQFYLSNLKDLDRRQLKLALLNEGLYTKVDTAIESIEDENLRLTVLIDWQESVKFKRTHPSIELLFNKLGLSDSQINTIWEKALKL